MGNFVGQLVGHVHAKCFDVVAAVDRTVSDVVVVGVTLIVTVVDLVVDFVVAGPPVL